MNKLGGSGGERRFNLFGVRKKNIETGIQDEYQLLTVRQLMIRKFLRNRMALLSFIALLVIYLVTLFAGFFAPYTARDADSKLTYSPPMAIRLQDPETGHFHLPFFYPLRGKRNMETFQLEYVEERESASRSSFSSKASPTRLWESSPGMFIYSVQAIRTSGCISWGRTCAGATCSRASSTAGRSRFLSAYSAC